MVWAKHSFSLLANAPEGGVLLAHNHEAGTDFFAAPCISESLFTVSRSADAHSDGGILRMCFEYKICPWVLKRLSVVFYPIQ